MAASSLWIADDREVMARAARAFAALVADMRGAFENASDSAAPRMDHQPPWPRVPTTVSRADRLATQLLAYAGGQSLAPAQLEMLPFLCDLAHMLQRVLDMRIEVSVHVGHECPPCHVDRDALEVALMNLVANARDAMPDGGRLRLAASAGQAPDGRAMVDLSVCDSGTGMDASLAPRAAQPFVTTKEHEPLAGMGLAATEGFARQSGGRLTLSCPVGAGVTATLSLPQFSPEQQPATRLPVNPNALLKLSRDIIALASDAVLTADEDQTIVMANPAAALIFHCPVAELVGTPLERFIPQRYHASQCHDMRVFGDTAGDAGHIGQAREVTGLRSNGEEFPIDAAIAHLNSGGRRLYSLVLRDMSERRLAEAAFRESEARLRRVLTLLPEAVVINSGNRISYVNEAAQRLLGADEGALLGRPPAELSQPDSIAVEKARLLQLEAGPRISPVEERIVRADGTVRIGEMTAAVIEDRGEASILAVVRDVTALRRTEAELSESHANLQRLFARLQSVQEDERKRIARDVHDDLQQRLAAIRIELAGLRDRAAIDRASLVAKLTEIDDLAYAAIDATRRIVNDLRPQLLDDLGIGAALDAMVTQFRVRTGINCEFDAQDDISDLLVGAPAVTTCLYRVTQEALNNVSKHSGASSVQIRLGTAPDGRWMLRIADDGCGISAGDQQKERSVGLLGMKERVRALSGELTIDSQPGKGTTIEILIPATCA